MKELIVVIYIYLMRKQYSTQFDNQFGHVIAFAVAGRVRHFKTSEGSYAWLFSWSF